MFKPCKCGNAMMNLHLRTVIYSNKVEILHVPVLSCDNCRYSEVFPVVKPLLTDLIKELGRSPEEQQVSFEEICEFANMVNRSVQADFANVRIEDMIDEHINRLLDLLILAQSLSDVKWSNDIRKRLLQITALARSHIMY